jgi:hypothetical protein
MTDNLMLIGCHRVNRVKSKYLFSSLSKFDHNHLKNVLTPKQIEQIKLLYKDEKIKYKTNSSAGGTFGVYFNVIVDWNEQKNKFYHDNEKIHYLSTYDKCCYYYNAKKLIIKIVTDMINRDIFLENMIYFNISHNNGEIDANTVKFILTDKENIETDVDTFLLEVKRKAYVYKINELVIKWIVPKTQEYGFIKRENLMKNNSEKNSPCYNNQKNILSNENFFKKYNSRNIENIKNIINNSNHGKYYYFSSDWVDDIEKIYKKQLNNYEKIINKVNKNNNNNAKINEFEELQKMLKFIANNYSDNFYNIINNAYNLVNTYNTKLYNIQNKFISKLEKHQISNYKFDNSDKIFVQKYGLRNLFFNKINNLNISFYPVDILKIMYEYSKNSSDFDELSKKYVQKIHECYYNIKSKIEDCFFKFYLLL